MIAIVANGLILLRFYVWINVKIAQLEQKQMNVTLELERISLATDRHFELLNKISEREAKTATLLDQIEKRVTRVEQHEDKRN